MIHRNPPTIAAASLLAGLLAWSGYTTVSSQTPGHGYVSLSSFTRKAAAGGALVPLNGQPTTAPMRATRIVWQLPKRCASLSDTAASPGSCLSTEQFERLLSTINGITRSLTSTTGPVTGGSNSNVIIINVAVVIGNGSISGVGNGTNNVKNGIGAQPSGTPRTGENEQD